MNKQLEKLLIDHEKMVLQYSDGTSDICFPDVQNNRVFIIGKIMNSLNSSHKKCSITREQFEEWRSGVHEQLFHVSKTDIDKDLNMRLDQRLVFEAISANPGVLMHSSLSKLLKEFDVLN